MTFKVTGTVNNGCMCHAPKVSQATALEQSQKTGMS